MNTRQKMAAGMAGLASMVWLGLTAAVAANQRRLVFNPTLRREVPNPRSPGHRTRPVVLRATDGTRLSGWLMTPQLPGRHPAVLYFGGRSEEVSWVVRDAARLFPGMVVLAVNYRGYGGSHGVPAEIHMVQDGRMLFDWLAAGARVDAQRIAVVGRSLGSGVAVQVAKERAAHAVVLITPYDSVLAIAKRRFRGMPIGYILRHRFESIKYAPSLTAPTYVLRAASDDVVPHSHTDLLVARLAQLCGDEVVPGSDHMNIPYLAAAQERIAAFLAEQFRRPAPAPAGVVTPLLDGGDASPAPAHGDAVTVLPASDAGALAASAGASFAGAPSAIAPSALAPSAGAPSAIAPSARAPSATAPSTIASSAGAPFATAPSTVPPSVVPPAQPAPPLAIT